MLTQPGMNKMANFADYICKSIFFFVLWSNVVLKSVPGGPIDNKSTGNDFGIEPVNISCS